MAEVLGAVTTATKFFFEVNQISIDNWSFKCFYKITTSLLLTCSLISTTKQFFGEPIQCDLRDGGVNQGVLNSYCWMYSTFNIPPTFQGNCFKREHDGNALYNSYYQWVAIFLVIQALLFYIPRVVWLSLEGGLMKFLVRNARGKIVEDAEEKRDSLIVTFKEHLHNKYNRYAMLFYLCETSNLFIVLSQILVINKFLHYQFLTYGFQVYTWYSLPPEERQLRNLNPMCEVFPRIASCDYIRFGAGGHQEKKNALCILGLNMINDKIFLVIWYWYLALVFIGLWRLGFRIASICFWYFRYLLIKWKVRRYFKKDENDRHIYHYIKHCSQGDWLVLYQMSRNMNKRFFADFLSVLSRTVNPHDPEKCNELNHFNKKEENHETDSDDDDKEKLLGDKKKRKMSHIDITFIDKDDDDDDKDKKDESSGDTKIGPNSAVDVLA